MRRIEYDLPVFEGSDKVKMNEYTADLAEKLKVQIDRFGNPLTFKGIVATIEDLPEDATAGDIYNVTDINKNYVFSGEEWLEYSDAIDNSCQDMISDEYDSTSTYAIGDYCIKDNTLYRCTGTTTGTWDQSKWSPTKISDNLNMINVGTDNPYIEKVWFKKGKNLFDKNNVVLGYELTGGSPSPNPDWWISEFIPVRPNTSYFKSGSTTSGAAICYYDKNKKYTTQASLITGSFTTQSNTEYIRINGRIDELNTNIMIEQGTEETEYKEYVKKEIYLKNNNGEFEKFIEEHDYDSDCYYMAGDSFKYYVKAAAVTRSSNFWFQIPLNKPVKSGVKPKVTISSGNLYQSSVINIVNYITTISATIAGATLEVNCDLSSTPTGYSINVPTITDLQATVTFS